MPVCADCGGTIIEYDAAAGNGFCVQCGTVVEENAIVNEISFGETAGGAAVVHGAYVAQGATRARLGGPFGARGTTESREQTIANATRKIQSIATVLRLSEVVSLAATRLYTLAVEHKFTKGRKSLNVVAVCLYVACRQKETRNYMLIDFSDLLQVNVFELGHTYLQLVQTLNLRLPLVDPSHYISRFAALLEFGTETARVATDAVRLVQRFDRDWMTKGRRPAGICGAALLLAARMNNFRRSVEEVVQVVKIADSTVRKRVEEFRRTGSAALTIGDFRSVWLEEEHDPPAFIKGKEKEREEQEAEEEGEEEAWKNGKKRKGKDKAKAKGKGRKRRRVDSEDEQEGVFEEGQAAEAQRPAIDPNLLNEGILVGTLQPEPLFLPEPDDTQETLHDPNIDPALFDTSMREPSLTLVSGAAIARETDKEPDFPVPCQPQADSSLPELSQLEASLDTVLAAEVSTFLSTEQASMLSAALAEADQKRREEAEARRRAVTEVRTRRMSVPPPEPEAAAAHAPETAAAHAPETYPNLDEDAEGELELVKDADVFMDGGAAAWEEEEPESAELDLSGLDDEELDSFLLTDEEVRVKERVWIEMNREYLEAIAARGEQAETGEKAKSRKRRKSLNKPRDMTTAHGETAAESVRTLLKKNPKYSKRINYDALKDLFGDEGVPGADEKGVDVDTSALYQMPPEDKDEEMVVVEEEGGGAVGGKVLPEDEDAEGELEGSDKGEEWGPDDTYEQEV